MLRIFFLIIFFLNLGLNNPIKASDKDQTLANLAITNLKFEELKGDFKIKSLLGIRAWKKDGINVIRLLVQLQPDNPLGVNPELFVSLHFPLEENYEEKNLKKVIDKYLESDKNYSFSFSEAVIARTNNFPQNESSIEEVYINDLKMTKKDKSISFLEELLSKKEALEIANKNPANTFLYAKSRLEKRKYLNNLNIEKYDSDKTLIGHIFNANKKQIKAAKEKYKEYPILDFYSKRLPIKASSKQPSNLFHQGANRYSDIFTFLTIKDKEKKLKLQIPLLHDSAVNLESIYKSKSVSVSIFKSKGPFMALIKFPNEAHEFLAFISASTLYDNSYTKNYNDAEIEDIYLLPTKAFDTLSCDDIYCIARKVLGNIPIFKLKVTDKKSGNTKQYVSSLAAYEKEGAFITFLTAINSDIGDSIKVSPKVADNYKSYNLGPSLPGNGVIDAAYNQKGHEINLYVHDGL